ncbi:STAS domain-containing protein [Sporosarcina beigongshangi]|uniref:STAS domain-containing protein n=1 Tax=Sporosarcina beigongshangi TaxID=2782538 RepID=UPI001939A775|nr:STAS domain-containing protein [Sporosarcina beigongshangi]
MDNEKEIQQLKDKIAYYELVIHELSAPIIPSLFEDTILVPIAGPIGHNRLKSIRNRVLDYCADHRDTNCAIFDFTGVDIKDLEQLDFNTFTIGTSQLNAAMKLMGIRPIYVGFNIQLVREIVRAGIHGEIETYANFNTALTILFNTNDKSLHST